MKGLAILLLVMSIRLGAAGAQQTQTQEAGPNVSMKMMSANCMMDLKGADIAIADTPGGVALTITAEPEKVASLQRQLERMAAMNDGKGMNHSKMHAGIPPATIASEAVEHGARLTLTPKDPAKLAEFRTQVRTVAERVTKGECPMPPEAMQEMKRNMMDRTAKPAPEPEGPGNADEHKGHHPDGKP